MATVRLFPLFFYINTIFGVAFNPTGTSNQCLITVNFEWSLDRVWTEYNQSDIIPSYKTPFGLFDHPEVYLYQDSESMQWSIGSFIGSKWYYCSERDIASCTSGKWMYFDGEWKQDIDAVIHFGDDDECMSLPQTTEFQTTLPVNETRSIQCGEMLSGTVDNVPDAATLNFVNVVNQDVTFTNCDSEFRSLLFLIDSDGAYIQDQSTNSCNGALCWNFDVCSDFYQVTFTMQSLDAGSYKLRIEPRSLGGAWTVRVLCGGPAASYGDG